jgi:hypothetical protein
VGILGRGVWKALLLGMGELVMRLAAVTEEDGSIRTFCNVVDA